MIDRIPAIAKRAALFGALALFLSGCVAYPAGRPYGYGYGGGWRAPPPAYAYAPPRPYGYGYGGGWGGPYRRW